MGTQKWTVDESKSRQGTSQLQSSDGLNKSKKTNDELMAEFLK